MKFINKIGNYIDTLFSIIANLGFYIFLIFIGCSPIVRPIITKSIAWQDIMFYILIVICIINLILPSGRKRIAAFMGEENKFSVEGAIFFFTIFGLLFYFFIVLSLLVKLIK